MAPLQTKIKNWIVTRKETVTDAHSFIFLKECGVRMIYICCPTGVQGIIGFIMFEPIEALANAREHVNACCLTQIWSSVVAESLLDSGI